VTRAAETGVPDSLRGRERGFRREALVDLTIAISLMNGYYHMAICFRNTPQASLEIDGE